MEGPETQTLQIHICLVWPVHYSQCGIVTRCRSIRQQLEIGDRLSQLEPGCTRNTHTKIACIRDNQSHVGCYMRRGLKRGAIPIQLDDRDAIVNQRCSMLVKRYTIGEQREYNNRAED